MGNRKGRLAAYEVHNLDPQRMRCHRPSLQRLERVGINYKHKAMTCRKDFYVKLGASYALFLPFLARQLKLAIVYQS